MRLVNDDVIDDPEEVDEPTEKLSPTDILRKKMAKVITKLIEFMKFILYSFWEKGN